MTGVSQDTLRYYEKIGLLAPIRRAGNGHRRYDEVDLVWVRFLTILRATGMPIRRMLTYVGLEREGDATIDARRALLEDHRAEVARRVAELEGSLGVIDAKIAFYRDVSNSCIYPLDEPASDRSHDTAMQTMRRTMGHNGPEVSAMGLGCWAIGGPFTFDGRPAGWGEVDDAESTRAIQRALDLGVTFFDTADVYGCGHSEQVLGRALAGRRQEAVISTKFGLCFDEQTRAAGGDDASPASIRQACEASLRRLGTEYIDLYLLHGGVQDAAGCAPVIEVLEELVAAGKIRAYGSSVEDPAVARAFAEGPHCVAVQQQLNVFGTNEETLWICEEHGLASINRSPLAMGFLSGKYTPGGHMPPADDVRRDTPHWDYFDDAAMPAWTQRLDAIRGALTEDGRTLTQGALAWIWAKSAVTIPIPGFRTTAQVEENIGAMRFGPLSEGAMASIARTLDRKQAR